MQDVGSRANRRCRRAKLAKRNILVASVIELWQMAYERSCWHTVFRRRSGNSANRRWEDVIQVLELLYDSWGQFFEWSGLWHECIYRYHGFDGFALFHWTKQNKVRKILHTIRLNVKSHTTPSFPVKDYYNWKSSDGNFVPNLRQEGSNLLSTVTVGIKRSGSNPAKKFYTPKRSCRRTWSRLHSSSNISLWSQFRSDCELHVKTNVDCLSNHSIFPFPSWCERAYHESVKPLAVALRSSNLNYSPRIKWKLFYLSWIRTTIACIFLSTHQRGSSRRLRI